MRLKEYTAQHGLFLPNARLHDGTELPFAAWIVGQISIACRAGAQCLLRFDHHDDVRRISDSMRSVSDIDIADTAYQMRERIERGEQPRLGEYLPAQFENLPPHLKAIQVQIVEGMMKHVAPHIGALCKDIGVEYGRASDNVHWHLGEVSTIVRDRIEVINRMRKHVRQPLMLSAAKIAWRMDGDFVDVTPQGTDEKPIAHVTYRTLVPREPLSNEHVAKEEGVDPKKSDSQPIEYDAPLVSGA